MRDRLIELINQINFDYCEECVCASEDGYKCAPDFAEFFADHLLANGIIVPPCKVGQTVYGIFVRPTTGTRVIYEYDVTEIVYCSNRGVRPWIITCFGRKFDNCDFGKTVFLTREEAEKALKERSGNNG